MAERACGRPFGPPRFVSFLVRLRLSEFESRSRRGSRHDQKLLVAIAGVLTTRGIHGGESEIRTRGTFYGTHAFQACALNHSAISPF